MRHRTYIVATDLSHSSRRGARAAARIAAATGAKVDLFCAIPPEVSDDMETFTARVDKELASVARLCAKEGAETSHHCAVARDTVAAVVKHAQNADAEMIVVSPHGASGASRFLLGSTTEGLMRSFPDELLVARWAPRRDEGRVLIAVDGSPGSKRALRTGLRLCADRGAEPFVVEVMPPPGAWTYLEEALESVNSYKTQKAREAKELPYLQKFVMSTPSHGLAVESNVREGRPVDEILAESRRVNAGLVVVGTQTRSRVEAMFVGSTARAVATHAKESVLLVRNVAAKSARSS